MSIWVAAAAVSMVFVIETTAGDVASSIALGVLLLSVVLDPVVRRCVYRIRAGRAWRSIQNQEAVDITKVKKRNAEFRVWP